MPHNAIANSIFKLDIAININTISNSNIKLSIALYCNIYNAITNSTILLAITIETMYHKAKLANSIFKLATIALDINS